MKHTFLARFSGGTAVLVRPEDSESITANLRALDQHEHAEKLHDSLSSDDFWPDADSWLARFRPYVVKDGILMIPVKGILLHDFPYQFSTMATGYEYIWKAFERGMNDGSVRGIATIIDSPGGLVAGCFDLVDRMYEQRDQKPTRAFAAEHAYSAAYAVGSAASQLVVARTGGVGSIGVVTAHIDISKALEDFGVKITFIYAGEHKVDGNPYEPLSKAAEKRIQARIDSLYGVFVSTIARNRGLNEQQIRDTEALTYLADEAVKIGLADNIGSLDEALAAFASDLDKSEEETDEMSKDNQGTTDKATIDAARTEGHAAGKTEGEKSGTVAERERSKAIMALPEAANRRDAAFNICVNTDMTVEQAKSLLATLPETPVKATDEKSDAKDDPKGKTPFEKAMEKTNPEIGAEGGESGSEMSAAERILAAQRMMNGTPAPAAKQ